MNDRVRDLYAGRYEPETARKLIDLYWRGLIAGALILILMVAGYGMWILSRIVRDLAAVPARSTLPPPAFDRAALDTAIQSIVARRERSDALKSNPPAPLSDPSKQR